MGLLDEFRDADEEPYNTGATCGVQKAMTDHPDVAGEVFQIVTFENHNFSFPRLERWLKERDIRISESTLKRHYNRQCKCDERMPERYA